MDKQLKFDSIQKCERILTNMKYVNRTISNNNNNNLIDKVAAGVIVDYSKEITCAILEESALVAKHRHSNQITMDDINLVLSKKLKFTAGSTPLRTHRSMLKSTPLSKQFLSLYPQLPDPINPNTISNIVANHGLSPVISINNEAIKKINPAKRKSIDSTVPNNKAKNPKTISINVGLNSNNTSSNNTNKVDI